VTTVSKNVITDIWINGEENNRNVWQEVSKRCMDTETEHGSQYERKKITSILQ
jgi:hypothetical protein